MLNLNEELESMDMKDNSNHHSVSDRVIYLERKVQEQEIEIKHLRTIVDDLSRKVTSFFVVDDKDCYSSCSLSKSLSRSYANVSSNRNLVTRPFSGSTFSIGRFSDSNDFLVMSTYSSPPCIASRQTLGNNNKQNGQFSSVGLPYKTFHENGTNLKKTENRVVKTKGRSLSAANTKRLAIKSGIPEKNGCCLNLRIEPQFFPEENLWKFFIGNRCVNLYGPSLVDDDRSKKFYDDHKFSTNFEGQQQENENSKTKIMGNSADQEKTAKCLKVEWIYGYRGRDCRSNLHFLPTGELAYNLGTAVVLFNKEENSQRHFLDHTAEIKCLCIHPNRLLLASGQSKSNVHITRNTEIHNDVHTVIEIQNGGLHLAAIEDTIDHPITIWDWQHGRKLAETKTGNEPVFAIEFHPTDKTLLISCGKNHVTFWNFKQDILHKRTTVYDPKDKPKYFLCIGFGISGQIYTGDSNGNICIWNSSTFKVIKQSNNNHDGPVFSLCLLKNDEKLLTGGGKDGTIMVWDLELNYQNSIKISSTHGSIRTLTQIKGDQIVIGTTNNSILSGHIETTFAVMMQGHSDEITCLDVDPQREQFLTGSLDGHVRCWDALSHSLVWSLKIEKNIASIRYHPSGQSFIVGCSLGHWYAMDVNSKELLTKKIDGCDPISCLSYSPNAQLLAVGSTNSNIYLYSCAGRHYERVGMCTGHTASVSSLDWASDNRVLRSNSEILELMHYDAKMGKIITNPEDYRNITWSTNNCVLSYDTAGAWLSGKDESQNTILISSCDSKNNMLATYDSQCQVTLRSFSCGCEKQSTPKRQAHYSRTGCLKFTSNGTRLISIGHKDISLVQWTA